MPAPPDPQRPSDDWPNLRDGLQMDDARRANRAAQRWLRYTGMGFQMLGTIAAGAGLGYWWDATHPPHEPWGLVLGCIGGCVLAMAVAVRIALRPGGH